MSRKDRARRKGHQYKGRLGIETLEARYMLAATVLEITGTNQGNEIAVTLNTSSQHIEVLVDGVNPDPSHPNGYPLAEVSGLLIRGLRGHDLITVDAAIELPAEIIGDVGNDTIIGGSGDDRIDGGLGHDSIDGGEGEDTIFGFSGNDTIHGGDDEDLIDGGVGNDLVYGDDDDDVLRGGVGKDSLSGGNDSDDLDGNAGNDSLSGDEGDDFLRTGSGRDSLTGAEGADVFGLAAKRVVRTDFNPSEDLEITEVVMPDFSLPDLNPNSATYNQNVGRSFFQGSVSAYYFTHAG